MTGYSGDAREIRRYRRRRAVRLAFARYRPLLWLGLIAATAAFAWVQLRPAPPAAALVVVAARDLPAGALVGPDDLTEGRWPVDARPAGALARAEAASGVRLAGPLRRGEPLTDARVIGPGLLAGAPPGTVAVPVRIADATAAGLARAGDVVDLYAVAQQPEPAVGSWTDGGVGDGGGDGDGVGDGGAGWAGAGSTGRSLVGSRVRVLARLDAGGSSPDGDGAGHGMGYGAGGDRVPGTVLVVAASPSAAARLATASGAPIALVLRGDRPGEG